jgi:hypothetical protein
VWTANIIKKNWFNVNFQFKLTTSLTLCDYNDLVMTHRTNLLIFMAQTKRRFCSVRWFHVIPKGYWPSFNHLSKVSCISHNGCVNFFVFFFFSIKWKNHFIEWIIIFHDVALGYTFFESQACNQFWIIIYFLFFNISKYYNFS